MLTALVVDDDAGFASALEEFIQAEGLSIMTVATLELARETVRHALPDILFVDLLLPDGSGLDLINEIDSERTKVIIITAHPSIDSAVESLRARVFDFLIKPLDIQRLQKCLCSLKGAFHHRRETISTLPADGTEARPHRLMVGESPAMQKLYDVMQKVAATDITVFLQGESGTGKELAAQAIHKLSPRQARPFLAVNCGAVSATLIGSELFGHERGSFTGANRQHKGFFERATTGTLFLDEITEMPHELQVQLLRVLETRKVIRVGGDREFPVDVRLIAATNRDPEEALSQGKLREDLFYRLNVFPIRLPPLRERGADVTFLSNYFLGLLNQQHGAQKRFTAAAIRRLALYPWPGNVRELRNAVQRAYVLAHHDNHIDVTHVADLLEPKPSVDGDPMRLSVGMPIDEAERRLILATLAHFEGNKPLTAETLGISLKTLYNRLKQYQEG